MTRGDQGYTLLARPPDAMFATVADDGAVAVTAWSFVRVRGTRDTWHMVGTRRGAPWVSSEVVAFDPGVARTSQGRAYKTTGPSADPTPAMIAVLHASLRAWRVPCTELVDQ